MTILADILNPEIPGKGGMVRKTHTHTQTHANMGVHPSPSPCLQLNVCIIICLGQQCAAALMLFNLLEGAR